MHQLVAEAFIGPRPLGFVTCHGDGDSLNNNAANLRYDTPAGNSADAIRHGTQAHGTDHPMAKLTEADVRQLRQRVARGEAPLAIAEEFGITRWTVNEIARRRTWQHVA